MRTFFRQKTCFSAGMAAWLFIFGLLPWNECLSAETGFETNAPVSASVEETNQWEVLRAYLQLQDQLHATQLAIERNRKEAELSAAESSLSISRRLQSIESSLRDERSQEFAALQSSNRTVLMVAGVFASFGFLAMLLMGYLQWRLVGRIADLPAGAFAGLRALPASGGFPGLANPEVQSRAAEESSRQLMLSLERLERRLIQLEQVTRPSLAPVSNGHTTNGGQSNLLEKGGGLIERGQALLDAMKPEEALACFDQATKEQPQNAQAWLKRGTALEMLRRLDEAMDSYDRAINSDQNLTVAYLHKGGLCNRMEKFAEALACYERALKTQVKQDN